MKASDSLVSAGAMVPSRPESYQTVDDVADGFFSVHATPVVQHVTDAACAVHEPHVCFTALWYTAETAKQTKTSVTTVTYRVNLMSVSLSSGTPLKLPNKQKPVLLLLHIA